MERVFIYLIYKALYVSNRYFALTVLGGGRGGGGGYFKARVIKLLTLYFHNLTCAKNICNVLVFTTMYRATCYFYDFYVYCLGQKICDG